MKRISRNNSLLEAPIDKFRRFRKLDELILPPVVRRAVDELVDGQQGADVLRANGLES